MGALGRRVFEPHVSPHTYYYYYFFFFFSLYPMTFIPQTDCTVIVTTKSFNIINAVTIKVFFFLICKNKKNLFYTKNVTNLSFSKCVFGMVWGAGEYFEELHEREKLFIGNDYLRLEGKVGGGQRKSKC